MRGRRLALALALSASPLAGAEVTVHLVEGRVDLSATAAPIADVLDRLSKQTGMKVVYDGPPPRQLVTVSLQGRTPSDAVLGLLEGQGLNYILIGDASGTQVQTLMMAGAAPTGSARPAASSPPQRTIAPPASGPDADEPIEEPAAEEEPENAPAPPGPAAPPGSPAVPGGLPPGLLPPAPTPNTSPAYSPPGFPGGVPSGFPTSPFIPTPFGPQPTSPNAIPPAPGVAVPGTGATPPPQETTPN